MVEGFQANEQFFSALGKSPAVVALVKGVADAAAARARAGAPVATGAYRDGIRVERADTEYRCVFRVVATADHSMGVESRTGNLARAIRGVRGG